MKLRNVYSILPVLLVGLFAGCVKDVGVDSMAKTSSTEDKARIASQTPLTTVNLGMAGNFAILSKSGITNVYKSTITGDIGASPITGAAILVSCAEVSGTIYIVLPNRWTRFWRFQTCWMKPDCCTFPFPPSYHAAGV